MKICLFDIDGTLLLTGGAGQAALESALKSEFNIPGLTSNILAAGRTDKSIVTDLFAAHQIPDEPSAWERFCKAYYQALPLHLVKGSGGSGRVLPGVSALLDQLFARPDIEVGLLTGNFETGALLKLRHYQLDHHFEFGGYGDHHFHRDDVARDALAKVHQRFTGVRPEEVWVIGDTPADVQCARAIGANALAVATGIFPRSVLADCRPDLLFNDLSDVTEWWSRLT